jgi:hypothetical protein
MSDPTLPVSQPEPEARRRKLSRKWMVSIAVVVVLALGIGGAAYGVHAKGDAKAKEYAKALDAWNDQKNDLVGAPSEANSGLWDFDDATTKKSLAGQKVACKRVLSVRKSTAKNAAAVPKAPDSFVKVLSSDERTAIKESVAREKAVKAYAKAADKVLVQLRRDCVWNIRVNSVKEGDSGSKKILAQAEKLLLKPGATAGNYYCPSSSKGSCLPASVAGRNQFASLILKAIKADKAYVMKKFFTPGQCESTSYGDLCAAMKKTLSSYFGNFGDYSAALASIAPSNTQIARKIAALKAGNKAADKRFKEALFKAYPDFKSDFRLAKNPFWQEAYFDASAGNSIQNLDKLRAVLLEMSGNRDSVNALGELSDTGLR